MPAVKLGKWTHYNHQIKATLRSRMYGSLADHIRQNIDESIFPYTMDELAAHLESHFKAGMGWHNLGHWHIDHVRPKSKFKFKSFKDQSFAECWALDNLRPIWAHENMTKHAK